MLGAGSLPIKLETLTRVPFLATGEDFPRIEETESIQ